MPLRLRMFPDETTLSGESGINTVVRAYHAHLPKFGFEFTQDPDNFDVAMVHAGMAGNFPAALPLVASVHGLYWTEDHNSPAWEYKANASVIKSIQYAREVTVPSPWVAETFARDMRFVPTVVPHGVDWDAWQHPYAHEGYVLAYAKNRADSDVCDPSFLTPLAEAMPETNFLATFAKSTAPANVLVTGVMPYTQMKEVTQKAEVFISPIKETFGLHALEALAAGVPVLSPNFGGVIQFVQHGVNGYLYDPYDPEDIVRGLAYCRAHRPQLSANAREISRLWTWEAACQKMAEALIRAAHPPAPSVGIVIPYYNKPAEQLHRAIESVLHQSHPVEKVVVVDDGSRDSPSQQVVDSFADPRLTLIVQANTGVSGARNRGAQALQTKYIGFLDADDWLATEFVARCFDALEADNSLHLAYTRLRWTNADGKQGLSDWPTDWNFDRQITPRGANNPRGYNQIPTANLMRRETFVRLGGYRSRYEWRTAGGGSAGAEDADLWTRLGAFGYRAALVTHEPLFEYTAGTGNTSQGDWKEASWLDLHPWVKDLRHPFASYATPRRFSHPVRQYDEPVISIVIPVGPKHTKYLVNALDNLDAQTFRKWEVIIVDDTGGDDEGMTEYVRQTFPYVRWFTTTGKRGAGYARNYGADQARGLLLVFLDADDNLTPEALERFMRAWNDNEAVVYSDYVGLVNPGDADLLASEVAQDPHRQVLSWDGETMVIRHNAALTFDWERAQRQPVRGENPYVPCLVTTLIPRAWHLEIGGFDEQMPSWEDVDYYWRMARAGHCLVRVPEPLVVYRFGTGTRRESGLQDFGSLLEYLIKKYSSKEKPPVACNCGKNRTPPPQNLAASAQASPNGVSSTMSVTLPTRTGQTVTVNDADLVKARYVKSSQGASRCIGQNSGLDYGYRAGGEEFLVHRQDIFDARTGRLIDPPQFVQVLNAEGPRVVRQAPPPPPIMQTMRPPMANFATDAHPSFSPPSPPVPPVPPVTPIKEYNVEEVAGIGPGTTRKLADMGIATVYELIVAGETVLREAGLPPAKAAAAFAEAVRLVNQTPVPA